MSFSSGFNSDTVRSKREEGILLYALTPVSIPTRCDQNTAERILEELMEEFQFRHGAIKTPAS